MMYAYGIRDGGLFTAAGSSAEGELPQAVWIDVIDPTPDEDKRLLRRLGVDIPTQEEMKEIEPSSRLYEEGGALYMTALLTWNADQDPQNTPVAFVITPQHLVTVRYAEPQPFRSFIARCTKQPKQITSSTLGFIGLTEVIVDRAADLLERCGAELDAVSAAIFREAPSSKGRHRMRSSEELETVVRRIGRQYDLASKVRESLVSLGRAMAFFRAAASAWIKDDDADARLRAVERDLRALAEHDTYLSQKTNFLLDATLGLINNDQNKVIKIFSVVAVIFLPPTLVASIYGMNFGIPELKWSFGYPWSLALMIVSALAPYWYFKRRGWL
jgi:Mg2+ and Co2+ transporters